MIKKKSLLFFASEKGYTILKKVSETGLIDEIGCVVSFVETNVTKSYHMDIKHLCEAHNIKFLLVNEINNDVVKLASENEFSSAFAVSWKYFIPLKINNYLDNNLVVFHDSLLPRYRGFSPTPTAIINGEKIIGVTALFASEEVDNGDILLQKSMEVSEQLYIGEIINKQSELYAEMFIELLNKIREGNIEAYPQEHSKATYSIWRNPEDCAIDWSKDSVSIYNFIRAIGTPYPGAFTEYMGRKIVVDKSEVIDEKIFEVRDYGKIWSIQNNQPEVICGKGMIRIIESHYEDGSVVQFKKIRCRLV